MEKLNRFEDKVVVITGASRGIGRGIALRFASEGAALVVSANEDRVNDVAEEIRALGGAALPVICDVSQKSDVEGLYDKALEEFGRVDISVQNAGIITIARVEEMTEDEWEGHYYYYCVRCPDKDVCVIEPEELDQCNFDNITES